MQKMSVTRASETFEVFGWKTPIAIRKKNMFLVNSELIFFNIQGGEIVELNGTSNILLAKCKISFPKIIGFTGFTGSIFSDNFAITLDVDASCSIVVNVCENIEQWKFTLNKDLIKDDFNINRKDFNLYAKTAKIYCNKIGANATNIECEVPNTKLAKTLGVMICSLLFDYMLDRGSHI